jgi:hypothetical protein
VDDEIAEAEGSREPTDFKKAPKRAVASGWAGSALGLLRLLRLRHRGIAGVSRCLFPKGNPKLAIIESLATYYGNRTSLADQGDLGVAGESGAFVEPS